MPLCFSPSSAMVSGRFLLCSSCGATARLCRAVLILFPIGVFRHSSSSSSDEESSPELLEKYSSKNSSSVYLEIKGSKD